MIRAQTALKNTGRSSAASTVALPLQPEGQGAKQDALFFLC
jgi:hypothetical protein